MNWNILWFILLQMLGISVAAIAQEEPQIFLDQRDGNSYRIVQINTTTWFQDNLRYETAHSYFPNTTKNKEAAANGNFYSYQEAQEVCPQGWKLPSEEDWSGYFEYILALQNDAHVSYKIDTTRKEFVSLVFRDTSERVDFFSSTSPLSLREFGWVQGKKIRTKGSTMSYWINHSQKEDKRFHVHLRKMNYTMHRHKHHVDDKRRKRRKFMVRCVSNK